MTTKRSDDTESRTLQRELEAAELALKNSEADLHRAEAELKRKELEAIRHPLSLRNLNPVVVAVIAALIGFLGNVIATYYQGRNAVALEREKFQSSLIVEYIKTSDPDRAKQNLEFLLETELLSDPKGLIRKRIDEGQFPVLSAFERVIGQPVVQLPPDDFFRKIAAAVGTMQAGQGTAATGCTASLISDDLAITADFCVSEEANMQVSFGYLSDREAPKTFKVERVEEIDKEARYAIVKLSGSPGRVFGKVTVVEDARDVGAGDHIVVVHHSNLAPLSLSRGLVVESGGDYVHYEAATAGGAAGAPVLNSRGEMIAVHTARVPDRPELKEGVPMTKIMERGDLLRSVSGKGKKP
jgi:hypothetical protein